MSNLLSAIEIEENIEACHIKKGGAIVFFPKDVLYAET